MAECEHGAMPAASAILRLRQGIFRVPSAPSPRYPILREAPHRHPPKRSCLFGT